MRDIKGHFIKGQIPWNKGRKLPQEVKDKIRKKLIGQHISPNTEIKEKQRLSPKTEFKKGMIPWNKGLIGYMKGEKHPLWKGDDIKYVGLHMWVYSRLGKPDICESCKNNNLNGHKIHWANVSGKYKRELTDWIRLCVPCHSKYDRARK